MPDTAQVGDKFHVIKLLLDAGQSVRIRLKRDIDTKKTPSLFKNLKIRKKREKMLVKRQEKNIRNDNLFTRKK